MSELRLLHVHSEHGYTESLHDAMPSEPEAVTADVQDDLTRRATRTRGTRARETWHHHQAGLLAHIDALGQANLGVDLASDLRVLARQVQRIDRRIAAL